MNFFNIYKFISQIGFIYIANAINGLLGLLSIPFVMLTMGSDGYGILSIYWVLTSYMTLLMSGVSRYFVRELSSNKYDVALLQNAVAVLYSISIILIMILPLIIYFIIPNLFPVPIEYRLDLQWITALVVIEFIISIPIFVCQINTVSIQNFKKYSYFISVDGLLRYCFLLISVFVYNDVLIVVIFIAGRRIIELLLMNYLLIVPDRSAIRLVFDFKEIKRVLKQSSVISTSQFFKAIMLSMGAILVNRYHGIAALGNYRAAFDITSKVWFFSNGLSTVILPKFSKMVSGNIDGNQLKKKLCQWIELSWFSYLMMAVLSIFFAENLLSFMKLMDHQIILFFQILILGTCLNAHSNISYEFTIASKQYSAVAVISLLSTITLFLLFFILNGKILLFSVAWAWLCSQIVYSFLLEWYVFRAFYRKRVILMTEVRKKIFLVIVILFLCISIGII